MLACLTIDYTPGYTIVQHYNKILIFYNLQFFHPMTSQHWHFLWLVKRSLNGLKFIVLLYACMPVLRKEIKWSLLWLINRLNDRLTKLSIFFLGSKECCLLSMKELFLARITKPPKVIVNTFFCFFVCVSMQ